MAEARLKKKNKQYDQLVDGSSKLHREIEDLESAYLLHQQIVQDDQNSVRGIIRKELGGSRWEHGGSGKIRTYKSKKDLIDQKTKVLRADEVQQNQGLHQAYQANQSIPGHDTVSYDQTFQNNSSNGKTDKILDLKTKVLKKASSNVIRRDTWSVPANNVKDRPESGNVTKVREDRRRSRGRNEHVNGDVSIVKPQKPAKRSNSLKRETDDSSRSPSYTVQKLKENKLRRNKGETYNKECNGTDTVLNGEQSQRRSRIDQFKDNEKTVKSLKQTTDPECVSDSTQNVRNEFDKSNSVTNTPRNTESSITGNVSQRINNGTATPRSSKVNTPRSSRVNTPRSSRVVSEHMSDIGLPEGIFSTQPPETAEIYIDPRNGQVRILGGQNVSFNDVSSLDRTKVLVQPRSLHNSIDGNRVACSIVDDNSDSSPQREIRDIFGLENFNTKPTHSPSPTKNISSTSPFAATRQCNTEVEFWLRSLGLPDVDKYVAVFAANDIDLTDLEFMSAGQLHDMGVTAFGALDRILKGIRDLKNQPATLVGSIGGSKLHASSIAWEEADNRNRRTFSDKSNTKASKIVRGSSCQSETFVKQSGELSLLMNTERDTERCSSAMSGARSTDTPQHSARSETPSFAASTKSSSAKYTEKRPPSAKTSSGNKLKSNSSQSQSKSTNSPVKLKRSNSEVFDKAVSKLSNVDVKPSKGVLIRPRSSSLTRESSRVGRETQVKKTEEKRPIRSRSRSADVVKRKALEGVHAAAKKFEEKKLRTKDTDKNKPCLDEKKKLRRDEMAARHLQRERYKEVIPADSGSSDTDEQMKKVVPNKVVPYDNGADQGLENLVTVNILSPPGKSDPQSSPSKHESQGKTQVVKPELRKSLRRLEQRRKQTYTSVRPIQLHIDSDTEAPVLSTYKVSCKEKDRSHSEPESGYRTDGSTTYSQIEDRVTDIQSKIKRLKARATSGDEMTLTLVHDLQEQLTHFERQLKDKEREIRGRQRDPDSSRRDPDSSRRDPDSSRRDPDSSSDAPNSSRRTPNSSRHESDSSRDPPKSNRSNQEFNKGPSSSRREPPDMNGSQHDSPDLELSLADTEATDEWGRKKDMAVRMSKQELLHEMRKEKQQHHRQIRQLQSELQKFRHSDPVTSLELDQRDITYKQEDLIGEGTFSCVYKGEFQGSEMAVKQLKMPLQLQDRNYFAAEVSLLKELRHPRVVLLIGVCTTSKLPLMVLEFMSKGSLFNYLHNPQCESLDHALYYQVSRDIALGMNYLHSHKPEVLHLDLKSVNVLLCQSLRAKIADFGFSKLRLDAGLKSGKRVKLKSKTAAPSWMSPELIDKGEITGKSDVYSFGIILWEMLTRQSPYKDCTVFQILEKVRRNQRPVIPNGTPEGLSHLISMCWDPNPAKRPQFKDVLQILENLAFPPAWRELFQKAGVPDSALQDVQSTRTIISLVTGTLDSGQSGVLHSFMVAHSEKNGKDKRKDNVETKTTFKKLGAFSEKKQKGRKSERSNTGRSSMSAKSSHGKEEDWDSDTVTMVSEKLSSDESELTLKNLRESSSDESDRNIDSDESSILTSDDDGIYTKALNKPNKPKTEINVVIPNLELSLQSARDKFRAERERISESTADWVSVSLDDHTDRTEKNRKHSTSLQKDANKDHGDMRLRLSSSLSNRTPSPKSSLNMNSSLNESARKKRRDQSRYNEEMLMRESFHNRRPPSPKKKSITKKFMDSSDYTTGHGLGTNIDEHTGASVNSNTESKQFNVEKGSFIEKSYDSFFDLSSQRHSVNPSNLMKADNIDSFEKLDFGTHAEILSERTERSRAPSSNGKFQTINVNDSNELCVEDMENEVENEMRGDPIETPVLLRKDPTNLIVVQNSKRDVTMSPSNTYVKELTLKEKADVELQNTGNGFFSVGSLDESQSKKSKEQFDGLDSVRMYSESDKPVDLLRDNTDREDLNKKISVELSKSVAYYSDNISKKGKTRLSDSYQPVQQKSVNYSNNADDCFRPSLMRSVAERERISSTKSTQREKLQNNSEDSIRVKLNNMLTLKDDYPEKSVEGADISPDKCTISDKTSVDINENVSNSTDSKCDDTPDDIRVKLDLSEVTEKKTKPVITPRRSIVTNRQSTTSNETLNEQVITSERKSKNFETVDKVEDSQMSDRRNVSVLSKTSENSKHSDHDGGSEPNSERIMSKPTADSQEVKVEVNRKKVAEVIPSPKKSTIRVKLRKDPLAPANVGSKVENAADLPTLTVKPSSPIPPAPPPPPLDIAKSYSSVSRVVKDSAPPRGSMADELKLRLSNRQSVSEGMLHRNRVASNSSAFIKQYAGHNKHDPGHSEQSLVKIAEMDDKLIPQQSEGLPSFVVQSLDLQGQKEQLRSVSKPHPNQIDDLSTASQEQLTSIADILKKAVMGRRLAMREDGDSVSQSLESAATGWSVDL